MRVDVPDLAHSVAEVREADEGDDQVRPRLHAPLAEGLAEVLVVLVQPGRRGRIEQAAKSHGRVQQQPARVAARLLELRLQQVVDDGDGVGEVVDEIRDSRAHYARRDLDVGLRHRSGDGLVEAIVELVGHAVDPLQGIARVALGGRLCAAKKQQAS